MENKILLQLQSQIGKDASNSVSPLMRWLNPTLLKVEAGEMVLKYTIRPEMKNPLGNLHGGITSAIVDDAIGVTVYSYGEDKFYATISNVIDFFGVVKDEYVIVKTEVIKKGKQLVNAQCEIWNSSESRMVARGTSTLIKTEMKT